MKSVLEIVEWIVWYTVLTNQNKRKIWNSFKRASKNLRKFYGYRVIRNFRACTAAFEAIPFPISLVLQSSLLTFLILSIMPHHPLAIPASLGGGISIALVISAIKI